MGQIYCERWLALTCSLLPSNHRGTTCLDQLGLPWAIELGIPRFIHLLCMQGTADGMALEHGLYRKPGSRVV